MRTNNVHKILCLVTIIFTLINISPAENTILVKLGVEVLLEEKLDLVKGKRVGLITNPTGVSSHLESTIDLLYNHPDVDLVALFGPEHGVRGDVMGGEKISNFVDKKTSVPVYSLYGKTRKPTPEMLKDVDVLIYDIQDIGSRAYTYIYTMAMGMKAAAEQGKAFIVLDRPNPLGGNLIEGPVLDPEFKSFIGLYPIPFVYGMTVGELAQLFNKEFGINVDLSIVSLKGWKRSMTFEDTGLEWVITSPHIPHGKTALFCAATGCIGELYTIDIGVGYTLPFELVGEEWINADEFAIELNSYNLPGVEFRPLHYRPYYFTRQNTELQGVQIHIMDIKAFQPMCTQIYILSAIRKLYPDQKIFETKRTGMFDKAMGTDQVRNDIRKGKVPEKIIKSWQKDLKSFMKIRGKYLLYK
jgi:uncharacterized protein YbbC (DUF1343 family)